jgi:hypothetical protein
LKLSKKDDKIRQKLIATLRTLPTISHRKSFLKEYRLAQMQNFRGN